MEFHTARDVRGWLETMITEEFRLPKSLQEPITQIITDVDGDNSSRKTGEFDRLWIHLSNGQVIDLSIRIRVP